MKLYSEFLDLTTPEKHRAFNEWCRTQEIMQTCARVLKCRVEDVNAQAMALMVRHEKAQKELEAINTILNAK